MIYILFVAVIAFIFHQLYSYITLDLPLVDPDFNIKPPFDAHKPLYSPHEEFPLKSLTKAIFSEIPAHLQHFARSFSHDAPVPSVINMPNSAEAHQILTTLNHNLLLVKRGLPPMLAEPLVFKLYESYSLFPHIRAYTESKENIYIHLRRNVPNNNEFYDLPLLFYVTLHEAAHVITDKPGHPKEYWDNFDYMLSVANNYAEIPLPKPGTYKYRNGTVNIPPYNFSPATKLENPLHPYLPEKSLL